MSMRLKSMYAWSLNCNVLFCFNGGMAWGMTLESAWACGWIAWGKHEPNERNVWCILCMITLFLHVLKLVFLDLWSWHFIHGFAGDSVRIPNQKWEILDVQNKRGGTCPLSWFGFLLQEQVLMFSLWSMTGILTPLSPLVCWLLFYVWSYLPTGVRWQRQKQCGCHAASFNRIIYVLFQVLR